MDRRRLIAAVLPLPARRTLGLVLVVIAWAVLLSACTDSGGELLGAEENEPAESDPVSGDEATAEGFRDGGEDGLAFGDDPGHGTDDDDSAATPVEIDPVDLPDIPAPEQVIPDVESSLADVAAGGEILDTVEPLDASVQIAFDRDGRTRNSAGELVGLDQPASLACANVEIALTALDDGDDATAAAGIVNAAAYAGQSEMASVQEWSGALAGSVDGGRVADYAPLIGFLTACATGGYEL